MKKSIFHIVAIVFISLLSVNFSHANYYNRADDFANRVHYGDGRYQDTTSYHNENYIEPSPNSDVEYTPPNPYGYQWESNENPFILRARVGGTLVFGTDETHTINSVETPNDGSVIFDLFNSTLNLDVEANYRWNDRFSFAASLGYQPFSRNTWTSNLSSTSDDGRFTVIPISLIAQYNIAPYGRFRPYLGAGLFYAHMLSSYDSIEASMDPGFLIQAGADYWFNKKWGINVDLKRYWYSADIELTNLHGSAQRHEMSVDFSPTVVSIGVSHRF